MSAEKGQKILYLSVVKTKAYMEVVQRIKKETMYQGMSFSKMCDLGAELVVNAYNELTDEEIKQITGMEEFNNLIREKTKTTNKES